MSKEWVFLADIERVVDGDTFDAMVDVGFNIKFKIRIRLRNIDTPETWHRKKGSPERIHGEAATNFVKEQIEGYKVTIKTYKEGTSIYGRYSADVILEDGSDLGQLLIENDLVKRESYPAPNDMESV